MSAAPPVVSPLIEVSEASYRYPGGVLALDRVSLEVCSADVIGIAGSNGAGKSTLARLLNGLLRPTSGVVLVDGRDTRGVPVHDLARTVGLVFQRPGSQLFARTVAEELAFGPRNLGLSTDEIAERVAAAADRFGLNDILVASPFSLPSPIRRLVAIASVVTMRPRVLVLDEPTTGEDHLTTDRVADLVAGLREEGVGVVCVTHDMRLIAAAATHMVAMAGGRVRAAGEPRAVFGDTAALAAAGLLAPQVTRLAAAVPGAAPGRTILTVPELVGALGGAPPGDEAAP